MAIRLSSENKGSVNMELGKAALAARYAQEAKTASESAQAAAVHPPVIGGNGNWQIWYQGSGYVDSGVHAEGPTGPQGPQGAEDAESVKVNPQTWSAEQKAQARSNIDAANKNLYKDNGIAIVPNGVQNTDPDDMSIILASGDPSSPLEGKFEYNVRSSIILGPGSYNAANALVLAGNSSIHDSDIAQLPWIANYVDDEVPGYPGWHFFLPKITRKSIGNVIIGSCQSHYIGFVYGEKCVATGAYGFTAGSLNYNSHHYSYLFGGYLLSCSNTSMVCGVSNNPISGDKFEVGNGASASNRSNAFRVTNSGKAIAQNALGIEKGDGTQVTVTAAQLEALLALLE